MVILGRLSLFMSHEGIFECNMVFIGTNTMDFGGFIINQFLDSSFKRQKNIGEMPLILMIGTKMFFLPP